MSLLSIAGPCRRMANRRQLQVSVIAVRSMSSGHHWEQKRLPVNTVINFVPHRYVWVVERFGKFYKQLDSGLNFLLPIIDQIKYVQSLKEVAVEIPHQSAITLDNVTLNIDGVLYYRVTDPYKASYGVENAEFAIVQLAQTTMRSELGKMTLDKIFQERTTLNENIVAAINHAAEVWGCLCLRYEIRDIALPDKVKEAMQMQVEAERKKRAKVLESEGIRESQINIAEGDKRSRILSSEGEKRQAINRAEGDAEAIIKRAEGKANAIVRVAESIRQQAASSAASLHVAEQYVDAFKELAKTTNTVILPANTSDVASAVAQAMGIYTHMNQKQGIPPTPTAVAATLPSPSATKDSKSTGLSSQKDTSPSSSTSSKAKMSNANTPSMHVNAGEVTSNRAGTGERSLGRQYQPGSDGNYHLFDK